MVMVVGAPEQAARMHVAIDRLEHRRAVSMVIGRAALSRGLREQRLLEQLVREAPPCVTGGRQSLREQLVDASLVREGVGEHTRGAPLLCLDMTPQGRGDFERDDRVLTLLHRQRCEQEPEAPLPHLLQARRERVAPVLAQPEAIDVLVEQPLTVPFIQQL